MTFFNGDRLRPPFLLKTADLAAWLHASCAHDLSQGGGSGLFLRKANLAESPNYGSLFGKDTRKKYKTNKQKKRKGTLRASCRVSLC